MPIKQFREIFLAALVTGCLSASTIAQIPERNRQAAIAAVRQSTERSSSFFSAHRMEDLEEILRSVRSPQAGLEPAPEIYEVSDTGYEFKKDGVQYHDSVHGPFIYFVAVANADKIFRISGFKDSQSEFNTLAKFYDVDLKSEFQAQDYANLYLRLDPAHCQFVRVASFLQLKQLAEREFGSYYKEFSVAELRFNQWWTNHENALAAMSLKLSTAKTQNGFEISFLTMSNIDHKSEANGPVPLRILLNLNRNGEVAEPKITPLEFR